MNETKILEYIKESFELKNQGYYKPAIEMLYKALALDGDNLEILAQLAHLYYSLENQERSLYYLEKVLDINPKHVDSLNLMKEIFIEKQDFDKALEIAEKIYQYQPTPSNLAKMLTVLNILNDFDKIIQIEEKGENFDEEARYEIALAHDKNYNKTHAISLLTTNLQCGATQDKYKFQLAKIYYEIGEFSVSKKLFCEIETTYPLSQVDNYLGLLELEEGNINKAHKHFLAAFQKDNTNPEYAYNLGSTSFLSGYNEEALRYFNLAICHDYENLDYHYSLAYLYYQKKDYDKAKYELSFIYSIEQNHSMSNVLSAMIMAKTGDLLNAKNKLQEILNYNLDDDFAQYALGGVYKELSQSKEARKYFEKAIELNPKSINYLAELLDLEFEQKNIEKALEIASKIIESNEKYLHAYIISAKIYNERNDFENLYDCAQEIIKLDSNCPEGYYFNAIALFEQGDKNFAIESLKKAISIDLNNAPLYIKMSEFYQEIGDINNALDWAQEASEIDERNYKYKWLCAKLASSIKKDAIAQKYYTQSYRLAPFDEDLTQDYSNFLKSIGKEKQAKSLLKSK